MSEIVEPRTVALPRPSAAVGRHRAAPRAIPRWITPTLLTALSLALGLIGLGDKPMWDDEAFTAAAVRLPWEGLWELSTTRDPHMLAFHSLLELWAGIGGTGEWWLRLPSVLAGAGSVLALWEIGSRLGGRQVGALAAGLLAVCTSLVQYQQEARPYALAVFVTCVAVLLLVRAVQRGGARSWLAFGVVGGLATYPHPMALAAVGGAALAVLALPRIPWGGLLGSGAVAALVAAPQLLLVLTTPTPSIWSWVPATDLYHLAGSAYLLTGRTGAVGMLIVAVAVGTALFLAIRRGVRRGRGFPEALALLWAFALPLAVVAGSVLRPLLVSRYLLPALPGVLLCVALVLARFSRPQLAAALVAVLVGTSAWSLYDWYTGTDKDDWRAVTQYLSAQARPGDGVILTRDHREPFGYYWAGESNRDVLDPVSPARRWDSPIPAVEDRAVIADPAAAIATHRRMWVVYLEPEGLPETLSGPLEGRYGEPHREQFTRVVVLRYGSTIVS